MKYQDRPEIDESYILLKKPLNYWSKTINPNKRKPKICQKKHEKIGMPPYFCPQMIAWDMNDTCCLNGCLWLKLCVIVD